MTVRQEFQQKVAAKFGPENCKIVMGHYDGLVTRLRSESKALAVMLEVCQRFHAQASTDCSSLLRPASPARAIYDALNGRTIQVKDNLTRLREAREKLESYKNKELDVVVSYDNRIPLAIVQTEESVNAHGMIERHRVFKQAVASAQDVFSVEVRF